MSMHATPRMTPAIYLVQQKFARYLQSAREVVVLQHDALLQYSPAALSSTVRNKPPKALAIVSQGATTRALAHCSLALAAQCALFVEDQLQIIMNNNNNIY